MTLRTRDMLTGYMFILPWVVGFAAFLAYPLYQSFILSFHKVDMMAGFKLAPVGFSNYIEAFVSDEQFIPTLVGAMYTALLDVPTILVFALVVAFLVAQNVRGVSVYRSIFFLPVVIASGLVVKQLYNNQAADITQQALSVVSLPQLLYEFLPPKFAESAINVLQRLTLVLWQSGIQILLFVAGFQGIGTSMYEAARVDGATDWDIFWKVTLPMLSPIILVNTIYTIVDSFTDIFNPMLDLLKNTAFTGQFRLGYAAAMGWVYFAIIFIIIGIVMWTSKYWVFYQGEREGR